MNGIYQAITDAMSEITPIAKDKRNASQGFAYRGIDDVMNELSPILSKHKIFVYPEVIEKQREDRATKSGGSQTYSILTIKYHFAHSDGSEVCATVIGEGADFGDKASNKAMAVGFKYACLQMFCIPTEDMPDPDGETPEETKPKNTSPKKPPAENGKTETKESLGKEIGEILKSASPDKYPFFQEKEKEMERAVFGGAPNLNTIIHQRDRLKKELEKRKAEYQPIPFNDDIPWEEKPVVEQPDIF